MNAFLRNALLSSVTLFMTAGSPLYASKGTKPSGPAAPNVVDVEGGHLDFGFNSTLLNTLASGGIVLTYHGSLKETAVGPIVTGRAYQVAFGQVDLTSGAGEFETVGNIELAGPVGYDIELRHMTLDTTGGTPVITSEVIWNGTCTGRIPVFTLLPDENFTLPLKGSLYQSDLAHLAINVSFASFFNTMVGQKLLSDGLSAGFFSYEALVGSASAS